jgi:dTDP-4-amino-4,6-dideoxygalactose transaminase
LTEPRIHRYTRGLYDLLGQFQPLPRPVSREEWVGRRPKDYLQCFSNAQALMGLRQLLRLDKNLAHRRKIAGIYCNELASLGANALCSYPEQAKPSWCRYPIRMKDRSVVERLLKPHAVPGTWFSSVLEESESPAFGAYIAGSCPNAESVVGHVINLPTHGRVRPEDAEILAAVVLRAAEYSGA